MEKKEYRNLELPSNGKMVMEEFELAQLADCCLYILPSNAQLDIEKVKKCVDNLTRWKQQFINHYSVEVLDELPCMCNHPKLEKAFKKEDYNLIMSVYEPDLNDGKIFLVAKTEESRIDTDVSLMIAASEEITHQGILNLMLKLALYSPNDFLWATEQHWNSGYFWKKYVERRIHEELYGLCYAIAPSYLSLRKHLGLDESLTHQKKMEMQEDFVNNLKAIKANENDTIAKEKVLVVLECLDIKNHDMLSYLKTMPDDFLQQFCNKMIPKNIANTSNLKMEVRWFRNSNVQRPTDGRFRLFLKKGEEEQQVFFKRKASFVLYLFYLLDVYNSEIVDTLNIKDNHKDAFVNLYNKVYYYGGTSCFTNMFGENPFKKESLRLYLSDIRISIGNACEKLHEAASPYILDDVNSHLCILKKNVIIDKKLIAPSTESK